jgi:hypothetical protein
MFRSNIELVIKIMENYITKIITINKRAEISEPNFDEASEILKCYVNEAFYKGITHNINNVYGNITIQQNNRSKMVFLSDEDYNAWVLNKDSQLERHISCVYCGHEGLISDIEEEHKDATGKDFELFTSTCHECKHPDGKYN